MQTVAIINPAAGGGRCRKLARQALAQLDAAGLSVETVETDAPGAASALAAAAYARGVRRFIAVGGDGTAFEVLNGALPASIAGGEGIRLGFLPLGTGNSFLRDFGQRGAHDALEALVQGRVQRCDVIRITHDSGELFYINILSLGFVADVCTTANRRFKRLGAAGYVLGVLLQTAGLRARDVRMRLDGGDWQQQPAIFVSLSNSRFTGGTMMMAPDAHTADGQLDVVVAGKMRRVGLLQAFPKLFAGTHLALPALWSSRAARVEFDCEAELDLMVDGEVFTHRPRVVEVLPGAIEVQV